MRLHIVSRTANPLYWSLLKAFGEKGPAPVLVNTSFNLFGEPLVLTPRDAIRSFYCSGTDRLDAGRLPVDQVLNRESFRQPGRKPGGALGSQLTSTGANGPNIREYRSHPLLIAPSGNREKAH